MKYGLFEKKEQEAGGNLQMSLVAGQRELSMKNSLKTFNT